MPNTIPQQQNDERHMDIHAAIAWYYGCAKNTMGLQFVLTVCGSGFLAYLANNQQEWKPWIVFAALSITFADTLLLERIQTYYRKKGAALKELLDTSLFELSWNGMRCGSKPSRGDYALASRRYRWWYSKRSLNKLRDWYPESVDVIPLPLARLICQRTNCWYDGSLRFKYSLSLYGLVGALIMLLVAKGIHAQVSFDKWIMVWYVPASPALMWLIKEGQKQWRASEILEKTQKGVDDEWNKLLREGHWITDAPHRARSIQDLVYDGRLRNPVVFNFFYDLLRSSHEVGMKEEAKEKVEEAQLRLSK